MAMIESSPLWKNRSFILYLVGQSISALGDDFYLIAFMWLAMEISGGRGIAVGGIFSIYMLNEVVFGFIAGPIADRINKKRLLIFVDVIRGLFVVILFMLVRRGMATITQLYVITFCFSLVSPFFHRTEFTIIPFILDAKVLLRGNGTLAGFRRLMQVIAPAIGGVVIALIGIESCFLIDSITFFISSVCIAGVAVKQVQQKKEVLTLEARYCHCCLCSLRREMSGLPGMVS
ncbi:MFS transporter [candidate division WOR-3 bacterium]|nr:MFS transporter [candidate division WOR-3 bacterium]